MRRRVHKELDPAHQVVEINMTPMIDCVFLLLIFFMVVSEMATLDMETLALPHADQARDEKLPESDLLTINIREGDTIKGIVRIGGEKYDKTKLEELVRKKAIVAKYERDSDHPRLRISNLWVYIRCDRGAKYEAVQWVFDACSRNGVYKTILAASPSTE